MNYEKISEYLLNYFFLTDWERTWLEARYVLEKEDEPVFEQIVQKYEVSI